MDILVRIDSQYPLIAVKGDLKDDPSNETI